MKKVSAIALAVALGTAAHAQVETSSEKVVRTESSVGGVKTTTEESAETRVDGATQSSVKSSSSYTTRLDAAYRSAGVAEADIVRLREIDLRAMEARRANDTARVKQYYTEQTRILQPAQVEKVRTYLKAHPAAATVPAYEVTTYESVPTAAGVEVNTPVGSIGVGVPTGAKVVEKTTVVPAN